MCQLLFQLKIPPRRRQTIEGEDAEITYFSQARQWPFRVNNGLYRQPRHTSAHRREADENDAKAAVTVGMSAVGGIADGLAWASESPGIAIRRHSRRKQPMCLPVVSDRKLCGRH